MKAQTLLKLLALVSIASTAAAVVYWQQTGTAAPATLVRISIAAFLIAVIVGLVGAETRPRLMLRFLAALTALIAAIALVTDFSREGGFTSLAGHLTQLAPSALGAMKTSLTRSFGADAWEMASATLFALPTFVVFGLLAFLLGLASRRRQTVSVFVN